MVRILVVLKVTVVFQRVAKEHQTSNRPQKWLAAGILSVKVLGFDACSAPLGLGALWQGLVEVDHSFCVGRVLTLHTLWCGNFWWDRQVRVEAHLLTSRAHHAAGLVHQAMVSGLQEMMVFYV